MRSKNGFTAIHSVGRGLRRTQSPLNYSVLSAYIVTCFPGSGNEGGVTPAASLRGASRT